MESFRRTIGARRQGNTRPLNSYSSKSRLVSPTQTASTSYGTMTEMPRKGSLRSALGSLRLSKQKSIAGSRRRETQTTSRSDQPGGLHAMFHTRNASQESDQPDTTLKRFLGSIRLRRYANENLPPPRLLKAPIDGNHFDKHSESPQQPLNIPHQPRPPLTLHGDFWKENGRAGDISFRDMLGSKVHQDGGAFRTLYQHAVLDDDIDTISSSSSSGYGIFTCDNQKDLGTVKGRKPKPLFYQKSNRPTIRLVRDVTPVGIPSKDSNPIRKENLSTGRPLYPRMPTYESSSDSLPNMPRVRASLSHQSIESTFSQPSKGLSPSTKARLSCPRRRPVPAGYRRSFLPKPLFDPALAPFTTIQHNCRTTDVRDVTKRSNSVPSDSDSSSGDGGNCSPAYNTTMTFKQWKAMVDGYHH